ncbi:hypothetical protein [Epibacterium ulvae]|nr:hypothetical protein [Epibacterium ulvae]
MSDITFRVFSPEQEHRRAPAPCPYETVGLDQFMAVVPNGGLPILQTSP